MNDYRIEISGLNLDYKHERVLRDVNISFSSCKSYLVIGRNGAGKTSLFNCLTGFESDYIGKINFTYKEKNVTNIKISCFPELFEIPDNILVKKYVESFVEIYKMQKRYLPELHEKLKEKFDLANFENKQFGALSKGMKKLVFLTLTLISESDLILLDEPFEGLDLIGKDIIIDVINSEKEKGRILIISSHEVMGINSHFDELVCLKKGEIVSRLLKNDDREYENILNMI